MDSSSCSSDESRSDDDDTEWEESSSSSDSDDSSCKHPPNNNPQKGGIYVLYGKGYYYVGKALHNVAARVAQHRHDNNGATFCKKVMKGRFERVPLLVSQGSLDDLESWERNETLHRMRAHGIERVRGWMFTSVRLTPKQRMDAFRQICEKFDLCRKCGSGAHFASDCALKKARVPLAFRNKKQ